MITVLTKDNEEGAERRFVLRSAYLTYDSEDPPRVKSLRISCASVKRKPPILWCATPMHNKVYGVEPTATVEKRLWGNF